MKTGIYKITNLITGKIYIGSAGKSFNHRWGLHKLDLRQGKHGNSYLQKAWDKYGESNFEFSIVEYCNKDILITREQYYLDLFQSYIRSVGYNICTKAYSKIGTKMPFGAKCKKQKIYVFTLTGEYVGVYETTLELSYALFKVNKTKMIWKVLQNRAKSIQGYVLSYNSEFPGYNPIRTRKGTKWNEASKLRVSLNRKGVKRPYLNMKGIEMPGKWIAIEQWQNGDFIKLWESATEIKKTLGITNVQKVCKGNAQSAGGFQWKYALN